MSRASDFLLNQYQIRKTRNPRYSQGAFARLLGVNSGRIAQYFSGKRLITKVAAEKFSTKLELDTEQHSYFLHLCETDKKEKKAPSPTLVQDDALALLVEWHHLAVYYLAFTIDFQNDPSWIASRLQIPEGLVTSSLERLERLGMLQEIDGKLVPQRGSFASPSGVPNPFLQMCHKDNLRYVTDRLSEVPLDRRDLSSIVLAIDDSKLAEARELIRTFRRKLAGLISEGKRNHVYTLNVQLFPLTSENPQ